MSFVINIYIFHIVISARLPRCPLYLIQVRPWWYSLYWHYNSWLQLLI